MKKKQIADRLISLVTELSIDGYSNFVMFSKSNGVEIKYAKKLQSLAGEILDDLASKRKNENKRTYTEEEARRLFFLGYNQRTEDKEVRTTKSLNEKFDEIKKCNYFDERFRGLEYFSLL